MLSNFYNSFGQKVPYLTEYYMENIFKDYIFFGRVDRVDLSADGTLQIVDYKTNKYFDVGEDNEEREKKTMQLKFYAYLLNSLKSNVTSASYYYFAEDKFDTVEFNQESANYLREWFDEIINDIRYDKTFERKFGTHCNLCDFYKLCHENEDDYNELSNNIENEELFK